MKFFPILFGVNFTAPAWAIDCKDFQKENSTKKERSPKELKEVAPPMEASQLSIRNPFFKNVDAFDAHDPQFNPTKASSFRLNRNCSLERPKREILKPNGPSLFKLKI
ncbi:MAG: hypothetical protein WCH11_04220 [Bdellovibrio sp.]